MRSKKVYMSGQPRGGTPGSATYTGCPPSRNKKDYHRQEVAFHGGDVAYERWVEAGRKGYNKSE